MAGGGGLGSVQGQQELRRGHLAARLSSVFISREITRIAVERSLSEVVAGTGGTDPKSSAGGQLIASLQHRGTLKAAPEQAGSHLAARSGS